MKMLVIFLGIVLLALAVLFVVLLFTRGIGGSKSTADTPAVLELVLAPEEEIRTLAVQGSLLAVHTDGPAGERILLVNPYTLDQRGEITVRREAPDVHSETGE